MKKAQNILWMSIMGTMIGLNYNLVYTGKASFITFLAISLCTVVYVIRLVDYIKE